MSPFLILGIGVATLLILIIVLRVHAFLALICSAIAVSLLAPLPDPEVIAKAKELFSGDLALIGVAIPGPNAIDRVATAFGTTAGKIGIVIATAAIIGRCLIDSGAADRIVRKLVALFGERSCPVSLMTSGFVLSVPVFFDTVFYLLLPLARSMRRRTGKPYLLLILSMGAGASITHSLVPPTPGPLMIAGELGIDLGIMISVGLLTAACTAVVMLGFVTLLSRWIEVPMRDLADGYQDPAPLPDDKLPSLSMSLLPILLPVLLITANTVVSSLAGSADAGSLWESLAPWTAIIGNANLAMLLAAAMALFVLWRQRRPSREELSKIIEHSLMSGGVIILITAAGGAFGAMLQAAGIGPAIEELFTGEPGQTIGGVKLILMGFFIAFLIKFAQGSSTVAMLTTAGIMAALIGTPEAIGYHPVYVACAIGFGAQCGNWMNDSGFWIFAKMSGLTEMETLKTWTVTVSTLAIVGLLFTILFSKLLPLVGPIAAVN